MWILKETDKKGMDVQIPLDSVSRHHAILEVEKATGGDGEPQQAIYLTDKSTFGTFQNGNRIPKNSREKLAHGDKLAFGTGKAACSFALEWKEYQIVIFGQNPRLHDCAKSLGMNVVPKLTRQTSLIVVSAGSAVEFSAAVAVHLLSPSAKGAVTDEWILQLYRNLGKSALGSIPEMQRYSAPFSFHGKRFPMIEAPSPTMLESYNFCLDKSVEDQEDFKMVIELLGGELSTSACADSIVIVDGMKENYRGKKISSSCILECIIFGSLQPLKMGLSLPSSQLVEEVEEILIESTSASGATQDGGDDSDVTNEGEPDKSPDLANQAKTRTANGWRMKLDKESHGANSDTDKSIIYDEKVLVIERLQQAMPTSASPSQKRVAGRKTFQKGAFTVPHSVVELKDEYQGEVVRDEQLIFENEKKHKFMRRCNALFNQPDGPVDSNSSRKRGRQSNIQSSIPGLKASHNAGLFGKR